MLSARANFSCGMPAAGLDLPELDLGPIDLPELPACSDPSAPVSTETTSEAMALTWSTLPIAGDMPRPDGGVPPKSSARARRRPKQVSRFQCVQTQTLL